MRILLQHPHAPGEISGVVTYCERLAAALEREGVHVRIFSTYGAEAPALWQAVSEVDVVHLNSHHFRLAMFARLRGRRVILKYHYPYWDSVLQGPFEAQGFAGRCWAEWRFLRRLTAGQGITGFKHFAARFGRAVARVALAFVVDRRLACSQFIARSCELPREVVVDYPAVEFPHEGEPCVPMTSSPARFVFAGRLEPHKGCAVLLRAASCLAEVAKVEIIVIGDGPERPKLERMVEQLGLRHGVIFRGRLERNAVLEEMARSTAVVVPSLVNEALSLVAIEAAALGRCVVGSRAGGIPELLGPDGLMFAPDDHESLAAHLQMLIAHPTAVAEARGRELQKRLGALCDPTVAAKRAMDFYRAD